MNYKLNFNYFMDYKLNFNYFVFSNECKFMTFIRGNLLTLITPDSDFVVGTFNKKCE